MQGLIIGARVLWLDSIGSGVPFRFPTIYQQFQHNFSHDNTQNPVINDRQTNENNSSLVLKLQNHQIPASIDWGRLIHHNIIWELYKSYTGYHIFKRCLEPDDYCLVVNPEFTQGQIVGEHLEAIAASQYLLASLDLPLFVNWLGMSGDLVLHASCIMVDGKGYCFAGQSGAGKSTLAALLTERHSLTALGEDHIILRLLDGQFWVFGTPWHENPALCSPLGAPLEKLIFLDRDVTPGMHPLSPLEGVARVLQTAFIPYYRPELTSRILECLSILAEQVPFFTLNYPLGSDPLGLILGNYY
jgi:hypothetical protein